MLLNIATGYLCFATTVMFIATAAEIVRVLVRIILCEVNRAKQKGLCKIHKYK